MILGIPIMLLQQLQTRAYSCFSDAVHFSFPTLFYTEVNASYDMIPSTNISLKEKDLPKITMTPLPHLK